jgi:hypothetical protein
MGLGGWFAYRLPSGPVNFKWFFGAIDSSGVLGAAWRTSAERRISLAFSGVGGRTSGMKSKSP